MIRIPYAREAGAVLLLAGLAWGGYRLYSFGYTNGHNAANVRAEQVIAEFAKAEAEAQARARKAEQAKAAAVGKAGEAYERGKQDAQTAADNLLAGLRTDNLRLRTHWQAALATNELSRNAAAAGFADGGTELRQRDIATVRGVAERCDAHVRGLQDYGRAVSQ